MRATHRIYRLSTCNYIYLEMVLKTFKTMVQPILSYSSELWGYQMRDDNIIESTFVKFCKHILGVHRKNTNIAVLSKLGVYLLKIGTKLNMLMGSRTNPPRQKPSGHKPPDKNPLDKKPPCQNPPGQNILFRNFITFVFRMSYGKEISIWFLAVKYIRHGSIK